MGFVTDELPTFRYHPDPVGTGSVVPSAEECEVCGTARGWVYDGPTYGAGDGARVCPWCIADGSAAAQLDVEFTDIGVGVPDGVDNQSLVELATCTPGFLGLQQEHWLYHCGSPAAFLGPAGSAEVAAQPDAVAMLQHEQRELGWSEAETDEYVGHLSIEGDATAYLFQCLRCGTQLAYSDRA
jgi:uncharacterized protein CbrC (UPF0167 family)